MLSRRSFMVATSGIFLYSGTAKGVEESRQRGEDREAVDEWMRRLMVSDGVRGPNGALHVGKFADRTYFTLGPIGWEPEGEQASHYELVSVPPGFVTDFASIPRIFWSLLPPDGPYCYAAIIHDYLYWEQSLPRDKADEVLKMCMKDFGVDSATIATIFNGVRFGGALAWNENAKLKAAGERRQLKLTPSNPTIRWSDWRLKPGVFY